MWGQVPQGSVDDGCPVGSAQRTTAAAIFELTGESCRFREAMTTKNGERRRLKGGNSSSSTRHRGPGFWCRSGPELDADHQVTIEGQIFE